MNCRQGLEMEIFHPVKPIILIVDDAPAGGGRKKITTETMLASKAKRVDRRGIAQADPCATVSSAKTEAGDEDVMLPPMHTTTSVRSALLTARNTLN